jgi:hypothetical protein
MSEAPAQDPILGDYAALLRIVLPEACGFYCYSQNGTAIWSEPGSGAVHPDTFYESALAAFLAGEGLDARARGAWSRCRLSAAIVQ